MKALVYILKPALLGVKLPAPTSFPVGKVNFLDLHPMSFFEFLVASGNPEYRQLLEDLSKPVPLPQPFH
jgi:hypothetical protein